MRQHIVFVTPPAPGHVFPTLPLVETLVARGHRVSHVVDKDLAPAVRAAGGTVLDLGWHPSPDASTDDFTFDTLLTALARYLDAAEAALPGILTELRSAPPDLVCCDSVALGQLLAELFNVPMISLLPSFATNEHFTPDRLLPGFAPGNPAFVNAWTRVQALFAAYGLAAPGQPLVECSIVFVPNEFQIAADTFDDSYHFIGPSAEHRPGVARWEPPGAGQVLLVSLGTAFNNRPDFFAHAAAAFADTDWHVVMAIGQTDPAAIGSVPPNIVLMQQVPQLAVLRHANAFVTHAGMGSTMESLYHRVPLVTAPQVTEQAAIAQRVQQLGLGRDLGRRIPSPDVLLAAVEHVASDPGIRASLQGMRRAIDAAGGAAAGADVIERCLR